MGKSQARPAGAGPQAACTARRGLKQGADVASSNRCCLKRRDEARRTEALRRTRIHKDSVTHTHSYAAV